MLNRILGKGQVEWNAQASMGCEGFSEYAYTRPDGTKVGVSYVILERDPEGTSGKGLHNSGYGYNDDLTEIAAEYMVGVVEMELSR